MKGIRKFLAGLVMIPAILFLISLVIGLLNVVGGAPVYGSQRVVGSMLLCGLFSIIAFLLWPRENKDSSNLANQFNALPDSESRADFIAMIAATRLGVSNDKFNFRLTTDLNYSPREVMNLWEELAEEFCIPLSEDDFPGINSIEELRHGLSRISHTAEQGHGDTEEAV